MTKGIIWRERLSSKIDYLQLLQLVQQGSILEFVKTFPGFAGPRGEKKVIMKRNRETGRRVYIVSNLFEKS